MQSENELGSDEEIPYADRARLAGPRVMRLVEGVSTDVLVRLVRRNAIGTARRDKLISDLGALPAVDPTVRLFVASTSANRSLSCDSSGDNLTTAVSEGAQGASLREDLRF